MATLVLVHGSSSGGWSWKKVTPALWAAGHVVHTPTMTGLGDRVHLLTPEVNLSLHIRDIVNFMFYEDLYDVILVGQSYGGMVITGVAEQVAERINRLVYLDAFIPDDGQSAFDIDPTIQGSWQKSFQEVNGVRVVMPRDPEFMRSAWGITDPDDLLWIEQRATPMPLATHEERIRLPENRAARLPRSFIRCTESPLVQFPKKARALGLDYHELPTGHASLFSAPSQLAHLLLKIASGSDREQGVQHPHEVV